MSDPARLITQSEQEERRSVLTTTDCARALGMSGEFIRGEIRDGRLKAWVLKGDRQRARYRIEAADFDDYRRAHWQLAMRTRPFHAEQPT